MIFFHENRLYISRKFSAKETLCMKYQSLFSGKNKKNISKCWLLKIFSSWLATHEDFFCHCEKWGSCGGGNFCRQTFAPSMFVSFHSWMLLLTLCMLGNFACFFVICGFFFKLTFSKKSFRNTFRVSNNLDPDQAHVLSVFIWVQIVCNGFQQTTKVATSWERLKGKGSKSLPFREDPFQKRCKTFVVELYPLKVYRF